MCGIYGMVGAGAEAVLPRMSAALVHRGPDGDGWAVRGAAGIGCRRLWMEPSDQLTHEANAQCSQVKTCRQLLLLLFGQGCEGHEVTLVEADFSQRWEK